MKKDPIRLRYLDGEKVTGDGLDSRFFFSSYAAEECREVELVLTFNQATHLKDQLLLAIEKARKEAGLP